MTSSFRDKFAQKFGRVPDPSNPGREAHQAVWSPGVLPQIDVANRMKAHVNGQNPHHWAGGPKSPFPEWKGRKVLPGWMIAMLAEQAERERARKAEIQEAADRTRFGFKQGCLDGCKWLQERGYQSDGRAPGESRFSTGEAPREACPSVERLKAPEAPSEVDPLDVLASLIK